MNDVLKTVPAVFAVGKTYQIVVPVSSPCLMWVKVGSDCYYDASNGIMRSVSNLHKMTVPMEKLDEERRYTVCCRKIIERKPYFTETVETVEIPFDFRPVCSDTVCAYHVADTHNRVEQPVRAARLFAEKAGGLDFLIMNGDIPDHSGKVENFETIYEIAAKITGGHIPIVFARGNHDMRGVYAEVMAEYTPCMNGNSYYTFRIGNIWGLILDCGEDKDDSHAEYGYTVSCHDFRRAQTAYIKEVIAKAEEEYLADGVSHRIIVVHNPFTQQLKPPFDIEKETYTEWARLLGGHVKPDVMICGHLHLLAVNRPGCEADHLGQPCTVVVGSDPTNPDGSDELYYAGCGYVFGKDGIEVTFTDSKGMVLGSERI